MRRNHREGLCWCQETHRPEVLADINGEVCESAPRVKQITISDPDSMCRSDAKHAVRFTTVFDAHSASSNVEYLTDAELDNLIHAATFRKAMTR